MNAWVGGRDAACRTATKLFCETCLLWCGEKYFFYVSIYFCCQGLLTYTTHKITDNQLWKSLWRTSKRLDATPHVRRQQNSARQKFILCGEKYFYVSIYFCCQGLITYTTHKITDNQLWKSLWQTSKRLDAACRNEGNYGHISWLNAFVLKLYCSEKVMNSDMPWSLMYFSLNLQRWVSNLTDARLAL